MATMGLTKGHVNGTVRGAKAPLQTTPPVEFIIRTPEGTSVAEYQLLRLDMKSDRREFRAMTGGIVHVSSGADKNLIEFKFDKVAPEFLWSKWRICPRVNTGSFLRELAAPAWLRAGRSTPLASSSRRFCSGGVPALPPLFF